MFTALALLAAASADPRIITPKERTVIEQAVLPELDSPGTLKIGPVPASAEVVCGRVNGTVFRANIARDASGRIVEAGAVTVLKPYDRAVIRQLVMMVCTNNGYDVM